MIPSQFFLTLLSTILPALSSVPRPTPSPYSTLELMILASLEGLLQSTIYTIEQLLRAKPSTHSDRWALGCPSQVSE